MNLKLNTPSVSLVHHQIARLELTSQDRIVAHTGTLWVTFDHDPRDVLLDAGQSVRVEHDGAVLVQALDAGVFEVLH